MAWGPLSRVLARRPLGRVLARLRPGPGAAEAPPFPPPAPEGPLAVIGDVHGRLDLLAALLDRLAREAPGAAVVLVGDIVDRGDGSRGVIDLLMGRPDIACLMGNHEAMLLEFLDEPERRGHRWLRNGGLQTLASYGLGGVGQGAPPSRLREARDLLALALGDGAMAWLRARPPLWRSGNVAVVHAGANPALPPEMQEPKVLHWGHPAFATTRRADGLWIAHGHVVVEEPVARDGRINVDTGAYATGRLTAALIEPGQVRFVQA